LEVYESCVSNESCYQLWFLSATLDFDDAGYRDHASLGSCSSWQEIFLVGGVWYGSPQSLSVRNSVKTMVKATMVGEGVSGVRSSIRGICAAILSVVTLRFVVTLHMIVVLGGKSCSE